MLEDLKPLFKMENLKQASGEIEAQVRSQNLLVLQSFVL